MKNIFLSASIPLISRDTKYIETADIIAIRDAVIALATLVIPKHRLIWGGHPSITPLIYYVLQKLDIDIKSHVILYQSRFFEKFFPEDNNKFQNVILTDCCIDRESSLKLMREEMLQSCDFSAGIFIGGMEGAEIEYEMFKEQNPDALILPIASTGAATKLIYDNIFPEELKNDTFLNDYGYMSLFQNLLINKI